MKLQCPRCRTEFDLAHVAANQDLRAVLQIIPRFGDHARLAMEYVELLVGYPLYGSLRRARRLFEEVLTIYNGGRFDLRRRSFVISRDGVAAALKTVLEADIEGRLTNHNYLKKVMAGRAIAEERERSRQEERDLRRREGAQRHGDRKAPDGRPLAELPEDIRDGIGKITRRA